MDRGVGVLKTLAQTVAEFLGAFGQIHWHGSIGGVVVERAQQDRVEPLPVGQQHAQRAVMKIQVPQPVDILAFITAKPHGSQNAVRLAGRLGCERDRAGLVEKAVAFHDRRIET